MKINTKTDSFKSSWIAAALCAVTVSVGAAPPGATQEGEGLEIYWLGTGITRYHKFPEQVAATLSNALNGGEVIASGEYVWPIQQLFLPDDHPGKRGHPSLDKKEKILDYLEQNQPEYVVIQTTYDYFRTGEDAGYAGDFPTVIRNIGETVAGYGGRMIFYESGWNNENVIAPHRETLYALAREFDALIAPCRTAQDLFRQKHPDIDWTYEGDKRHPGQYFLLLNELVFVETILGRIPDVVDNTIEYRRPNKELDQNERMVERTIDPDLARSLRVIAAEAVGIAEQRLLDGAAEAAP